MHGRLVERYTRQTGGAQLGPPAAEAAQNYNLAAEETVELAGCSQLEPLNAVVHLVHDDLGDLLAEVTLG